MKISLEKATIHWFSKSISSEKTERGLRCGCQKFWLFLVIATISSDVGTVRKQRNGFRLIFHQSRALWRTINPSKSTQLSISGMQTFSINFRRMVIDKHVYERKNTFELGRGSWLSHPRSTCGHSCHTRTTENDLALALIL